MSEYSVKIAETIRGPVEYGAFGEGPVVLSLHGAMGGHDQSRLLAQTIGVEGFRTIAVSRPGYLGTPLGTGRTASSQADLCALLLDTLKIESVLVMAVSGGGPAALEFAIRYPERCRGLVLASACTDVMDTPIPFAFTVMKTLAYIPWFVSFMRRMAEKDIDKVAQRSIPDAQLRAQTLSDPEAGPLFKALLLSAYDRMGQRLSGTTNDIEITRSTAYGLEQISAPVLSIHGTDDSVVPYIQHAAPLAERIPHAEHLTIEGGEHVVIFTHLKEVRERVGRFLTKHAHIAS
ncbi:MAG: alpha/beta hydrolase [Magnetococcales bacterium]|nr:alpha/beta hydrolase [Magnetococcales bacterium]